MADAALYLEAIADDLRQSGYLVDVRVEIGEPANHIVQVAEELDIDLIIMATHGHSGMSRWFLGSVSARVLSIATRPVLIVPSSPIEEQFERQSPEVNYG